MGVAFEVGLLVWGFKSSCFRWRLVWWPASLLRGVMRQMHESCGGRRCLERLAVVSVTLPPSASSQRVLRMASVAALAMAAGALEGWGRCSKVVPGKCRDLAVRVSWSTAQPALVSCLTRVTA